MTELISIREFARREGCDEKQVRRAIEKGLLYKDSSSLLNAAQIGNGWRKTNRRGRDAAMARNADNSNVRRESVRADLSAREGETPSEAAERIVLKAAPFDRIEAERVKENYLALLKKLEYEQKENSLIEMAVAEKILFDEARRTRDSWLNWPCRVGPLMAADLGLEADRMTEVLTAHVHDQLCQLGEPNANFAS